MAIEEFLPSTALLWGRDGDGRGGGGGWSGKVQQPQVDPGSLKKTLPTLMIQLHNHFSEIRTWIAVVLLVGSIFKCGANLVFIIQYWKAACMHFVVLYIYICWKYVREIHRLIVSPTDPDLHQYPKSGR